ncbi:hypothetical protein ACFVVU_26795 [Kitasatospora sp. NPDC057965]|uniref:hypothetical protein n=1 Tax=Kitasatospora sp. NPDC057965 TaxID=3346291 RepID=UPI0036D79AF6
MLPWEMVLIMRRSTVLAVALAAVSIVGLVGCGEGPAPAAVSTASPAAPATAAPTFEASTAATTTASPTAATTAGGEIDPAQALVLAEKTPYAATQDFKSEGAAMATVVKGRVNLNGPVRTGELHETAKSGPVTVLGGDGEDPNIIVADNGTTYRRSEDGWSVDPQGDRIPDYHSYAKLLLSLGPSAYKGVESCDGTPCFHLSGAVDLERIRTVEVSLYQILKAKRATEFQLDQWIDAQGRTVRYDRLVEFEGLRVRTSGTFRNFGPAEKVHVPPLGGAVGPGA